MTEKIEPKLGDPIPKNWLERAKSELKANFRVIKLDNFRGQDNVELNIFRPSLKIDSVASYKYSEVYNDLLSKKLLLKDEMLKILEEKNLWGEPQEKEIEDIKEGMREVEIKAALIRSKPNFNKASLSRLREEYLILQKKFTDLITKKTQYLNNTVESKAEEEQIKVKLSLCVKYPDGKLVWNSLEELENETDGIALTTITNEFMTFSLGLTQEIIDHLPDQIFEMVGEAVSEK